MAHTSYLLGVLLYPWVHSYVDFALLRCTVRPAQTFVLRSVGSASMSMVTSRSQSCQVRLGPLFLLAQVELLACLMPEGKALARAVSLGYDICMSPCLQCRGKDSFACWTCTRECVNLYGCRCLSCPYQSCLSYGYYYCICWLQFLLSPHSDVWPTVLCGHRLYIAWWLVNLLMLEYPRAQGAYQTYQIWSS